MPLLVPTLELEPGMKLAEPMMYNGRVMLQGGRCLTAADVEVLGRRFPKLSLRIGDPVLDSLIEFEDDAPDRLVAADVQEQVARRMTEVHERFRGRAVLGGVQVGALQRTVRSLMDFLRENPVSAALVSTCMDHETYLAEHAGNVFYLSMLLGFRMLDYVIQERKRQTRVRNLRSDLAMDLVPLGLGAILMDLGLLSLQPVLKSDGPLTEGESQALWQHPTAGADMLPDSISALTRMLVRTHHENIRATGYPGQKGRDRVHVFARIVRIADAYDAATSMNVYHDARSPARVLWEMTLGPYRAFYDPRLIRAFVTLIQPFPIGTKLRLSDGRYAAVVRYNRKNPFDPVVIIAFDQQNQRLPREKLEGPFKLSTRRDLRLTAMGDEDLSYMYTRAPSITGKLRTQFRTPLEASYP